MGKIIEYPNYDIDNIPIAVQRTEGFHAIAQDLSKLIGDLPLTTKQNDDLVFKIIEQVTEAERGAFMQGVQMGIEITQGLTQDKH